MRWGAWRRPYPPSEIVGAPDERQYLTAKEWQKFATGRGYKDAALVKTLAAAEKSDNAPASEQLELLKAVETAGRALFSLNKGDKKLEAYLDDVTKAVKLARKNAETAQAKDEKADAAKAANDAKDQKDEKDSKDDEKPNVLLDPKRMLAQLMACKKDPARKIEFAYVDGRDKVPAAAAMSHNVSGRKMFALLSEEIGVKTGSYGLVLMQGTELILQPEKALGGLAKKMRGPVKACGFRVTAIVLWNADGTVLEKEAAADDSDAAEDAANGSGTGSAAEAALMDRLKAMLPRVTAVQASLEGQAAKADAALAPLKAQWQALDVAIAELESFGLDGSSYRRQLGGGFDPATASKLAAGWETALVAVRKAHAEADGGLKGRRKEGQKKIEELKKATKARLSSNRRNFTGFFEDFEAKLDDADAML